MASCTKDINDIEIQSNAKLETQKSINEQYDIQILNFSGNQITSNQINMETGDAVLFVEPCIDNSFKYTLRYFKSEEDAYNYVCTTKGMEEIKIQMDYIKSVRDLAQVTGDINIDDPNEISKELKILFSNSSFEQTKGVGILFDNLNGTGSFSALTGNPQPTLFSFNNRAESAKGIGLANRIFDKKWFRGNSVYLLLGTAGLIPFDGINFRNKAESGI